MVQELGLQKASKGLDVPKVVEAAGAREGDRELGLVEAKQFRRIAALANSVAVDAPDVQAAVSHLCGAMAKRTEGTCRALMRVGRYLKKYPRVIFESRTAIGPGAGGPGRAQEDPEER